MVILLSLYIPLQVEERKNSVDLTRLGLFRDGLKMLVCLKWGEGVGLVGSK